MLTLWSTGVTIPEMMGASMWLAGSGIMWETVWDDSIRLILHLVYDVDLRRTERIASVDTAVGSLLGAHWNLDPNRS